MMQNPDPKLGNAWCVPPAVLDARPYSNASSAVNNVPDALLPKLDNRVADSTCHFCFGSFYQAWLPGDISETNSTNDWVIQFPLAESRHIWLVMYLHINILCHKFLSQRAWNTISSSCLFGSLSGTWIYSNLICELPMKMIKTWSALTASDCKRIS